MIDQVVPFAVAAGAVPLNVAPTNFNPVPADGFVEIQAVLDALQAGDFPASISVTLGGATPYTPVPFTALRVNVDGVNGAGPTEKDVVLSRQGVRQGTNFQVNLSGGTGHTQTGRIRFRFISMDELQSGAGSVAA